MHGAPDTGSDVFINGVRAGRFSLLGNNRVGLSYDETWRSRPGSFSLSASLPLAAREHVDTARSKRVSNYLWGLLPDNDATLKRWARRFGIGLGNPLKFLMAIGADCPGALSFEQAMARSIFRPLSDQELSDQINAVVDEGGASSNDTEMGYFSLAGAQAKIALARTKNGWALPSGEAASTHILKPAMAGLKDQVINEHFCLSLAKKLGLPSATSEPLVVDDVLVLAVQRFDRRVSQAGHVVRIHQEDMCQAMGVDPRKKYQRDGGPSVKDIARIIRSVSDNPEEDVRKLMGALIFNWLIAGTDAHSKNYSLLYAPGRQGPQARLAPLYDLNSMWPYASGRNDLRGSMKIGGHYKHHEVLPRHFVAEAVEMGINSSEAQDQMKRMVEAAPVAGRALAQEMADKGLRSPILADINAGIASSSKAFLNMFVLSENPGPTSNGLSPPTP